MGKRRTIRAGAAQGKQAGIGAIDGSAHGPPPHSSEPAAPPRLVAGVAESDGNSIRATNRRLPGGRFL
jgi:hypothetical protein